MERRTVELMHLQNQESVCVISSNDEMFVCLSSSHVVSHDEISMPVVSISLSDQPTVIPTSTSVCRLACFTVCRCVSNNEQTEDQ